MNQNESKPGYYEEEIDLKEVILTLWNHKKTIIGITLIAAILAGVWSIYFISPVYQAKLNIVMNMPATYNTRYGEYTLPITSNEQYINLITSNDVLINTIQELGYDSQEVSVDKIRERISIGQVNAKAGTVQNSFNITVSATTPEEALKLAQAIYNNYVEFLDVMTKERAISYYYNNFSVQLKSLKIELGSKQELLKKNEQLLAQTPHTINQKEAMGALPASHATSYVVLENIINPNYTKVENDLIVLKQEINTIDNTINLYNQHLQELNQEKQTITQYYETGKVDKLQSSIISVIETSVYLPSPPIAPTQKTSPRNALNVAIGTVLGGMLAVMFVLGKEWFKGTSK